MRRPGPVRCTEDAMMYVQYSFIDRREPIAFKSPPVELSPALVVWAGILAMLASVAMVVMLA
jgi:hypothetical protein